MLIELVKVAEIVLTPQFRLMLNPGILVSVSQFSLRYILFKDLNRSVHGSFTGDCPKLETVEMSINNRRMDKQGWSISIVEDHSALKRNALLIIHIMDLC